MAVEGMEKCGELPSAEVRGEKEHAFAAGMGLLKILEAFVDDDLLGILQRVLGKAANLGELTAERGKFSAQNAGTLGCALFRKRELQVAHAGAAQTTVQQVDRPGDEDGQRARQRTRQ